MLLGFSRIADLSQTTAKIDINLAEAAINTFTNDQIIEYVDDDGYHILNTEPYSQISSQGYVLSATNFCLGNYQNISKIVHLSPNFTDIVRNRPIPDKPYFGIFNTLSNLLEMNLQGISSLGKSAIYNNQNLVSIDTTTVKIFDVQAIHECPMIEKLDLDSAEKLYDFALFSNINLVSVDLTRNPNVPWIEASSIFKYSGMKGYCPDVNYLSVFVPINLYSSYLSDPTWSQLSSIIYPCQEIIK